MINESVIQPFQHELEELNEDISDVSREIEHIYTEINASDIPNIDKHYYQKRLEFLKEELKELKEEKSDVEARLLELKK